MKIFIGAPISIHNSKQKPFFQMDAALCESALCEKN